MAQTTHPLYSSLKPEAELYWRWHQIHPMPKLPAAVAREGAGSELRTPLMHVGTVMPVYLAILRHLDHMPLKKGMKLLELGSGSGRALSYLKARFPDLDVYGVDYTQACIDYANSHYKKFGVKFKHISPHKTAFKDQTFDFVISSHVIEHVTKAEGEAFLAECRRLLKRNGTAFVGTPNRDRCQNVYMENPTDDPRFRLVPPHEHEYMPDELLALGQQVFGAHHATVDKLQNPLFATVFTDIIAKFRPGPSTIRRLRQTSYKLVSTKLPRPLLDKAATIGMNQTVRRHKTSYEAILYANVLAPQTSKKPADNLLLICKR